MIRSLLGLGRTDRLWTNFGMASVLTTVIFPHYAKPSSLVPPEQFLDVVQFVFKVHICDVPKVVHIYRDPK